MKKLRKVLALVLAMVMVLGMSTITAFAEQTYSITVKDGYKGETYTAYKVFDAKYTGNNVAYTISSSGKWFSDIVGDTKDETNGDYILSDYGIKFQKTTTTGVYNVVNAVDGTSPTPNQMAALAALLATKTDGKTSAGSAKVDKETGDSYGAKADVTINVNPDEAGYYFVTTTTGSLCALNTTKPKAEVEEKNDLPTVDKKQSTTGTTYTDDNINLSVGDTVYYQITLTDGQGTDSAITLTDTMSAGLTYKSGSIKIDGTDLADNADNNNYKITVSGQTITILIKDSKVNALAKDATVVITYEATINDSAVTKSEETNDNHNKNTVVLDYSNQSTKDSVELNTFKFQLVKDNDSKKVLEGAKFKLYTSETGRNPIGLIKDADTNTYRPLKSDESSTTAGYTTEITAGKPIFKGFKNGTYWFEETEAPTGYNKLTERKPITIESADNVAAFNDDNSYKEGGLEVINKTGSVLPSTGGIGTTIFYVFGAVLVIGAGIVLVARRRMAK